MAATARGPETRRAFGVAFGGDPGAEDRRQTKRTKRPSEATLLNLSSPQSVVARLPISILLLVAVVVGSVKAIDCFKCVSINGSYPACDDPFHNNYTTELLESPCMGGRKGRNGLFPATACIKLAGIYDDSGKRLTVRGCALDSGTLTTDTEIIRMSHCGGFYFDGRYVRGCLQSCDDADACNHAAPSTNLYHMTVTSVIVTALSSTSILGHCSFR